MVKYEYTVDITKPFISEMENVKAPKDYLLALIDVKSLFTNVPHDKTIEFALKRICIEREIEASISRADMKDLQHSFLCSNEAYLEIDGTAIGSPLGRFLDGILMAKFKRTLVPALPQYTKL